MLQDNKLQSYRDTVTFTACFESYGTTNIYLKDITFTNEAPFILPFDATLISLAISGHYAETWIGELHSNGTLISGCSVSLNAEKSGVLLCNMNMNAGMPIEMYCKGIGIAHPRITAVFRRR